MSYAYFPAKFLDSEWIFIVLYYENISLVPFVDCHIVLNNDTAGALYRTATWCGAAHYTACSSRPIVVSAVGAGPFAGRRLRRSLDTQRPKLFCQVTDRVLARVVALSALLGAQRPVHVSAKFATPCVSLAGVSWRRPTPRRQTWHTNFILNFKIYRIMQKSFLVLRMLTHKPNKFLIIWRKKDSSGS